MRTAKCHPQAGWLRLEPRDYAASLDQLMVFRDQAIIAGTFDGSCPESYLEWMETNELPRLLTRDRYRKQFEEHLEYLEAKITAIDKDITKQSASLLEEKKKMKLELVQLSKLLE